MGLKKNKRKKRLKENKRKKRLWKIRYGRRRPKRKI